MRQRELEIRLERVPPHPSPDPNLEQYRTPTPIAADLLYRALARGDIQDRDVVDLGCGTGMFVLGAALLGARSVRGVEVDATAVEVAREVLAEEAVAAEIQVSRVEDFEGTADTVVMNPPFGAQFGQRHADTLFLKQALKVAPVVYSLHLEATLEHLERTAGALGTELELLARYQFALPAQFRFHTKQRVLVPVVLLRYQRRG